MGLLCWVYSQFYFMNLLLFFLGFAVQHMMYGFGDDPNVSSTVYLYLHYNTGNLAFVVIFSLVIGDLKKKKKLLMNFLIAIWVE